VPDPKDSEDSGAIAQKTNGIGVRSYEFSKDLLGADPDYSEDFGVRSQKALKTLGPDRKTLKGSYGFLKNYMLFLKNYMLSLSEWQTLRRI
jgi:hypothetical protein